MANAVRCQVKKKKHESVDRLIRRFSKQATKEDIVGYAVRNMAYEKPSERKRRKKSDNQFRKLKEERELKLQRKRFKKTARTHED